jgi:hypothetical protein
MRSRKSNTGGKISMQTPDGSEIMAIPIYLSGPNPPIGSAWCAICIMLYAGTLGADPAQQEDLREKYTAALASGQTFLMYPLPERDEMQLQPAITVALCVLDELPWPMPVCWTHVKGFRFKSGEERKHGQPGTRLITGKKFGNPMEWGMEQQ